MSLVSKAKQLQQYTTERISCSSCAHFQSDFSAPPWMVQYNEQHKNDDWANQYDLTAKANMQEKNMRCGIGGFAVKKTASCARYELRNLEGAA